MTAGVGWEGAGGAGKSASVRGFFLNNFTKRAFPPPCPAPTPPPPPPAALHSHPAKANMRFEMACGCAWQRPPPYAVRHTPHAGKLAHFPPLAAHVPRHVGTNAGRGRQWKPHMQRLLRLVG